MPNLRVVPDVIAELRQDETVLDCLYRHGYAYRIGCRRGGCGVCKVDIVMGAVRYPKTVSFEVLTLEERSDGTCLTCRAVPEGDLTVALRDDELSRNPLLAIPFRRSAAEATLHTTRTSRIADLDREGEF